MWVLLVCLCPAARALDEAAAPLPSTQDATIANALATSKLRSRASGKSPIRAARAAHAKSAHRRTLAAPARNNVEATNDLSLPRTVAQVFPIEHSSPERIDPELARQALPPMPEMLAQTATGNAERVEPELVVEPEPELVESAPDIPMEIFIAWAGDSATLSVPPKPSPVTALPQHELVKQVLSLVSTVGNWLRRGAVVPISFPEAPGAAGVPTPPDVTAAQQ